MSRKIFHVHGAMITLCAFAVLPLGNISAANAAEKKVADQSG